MSCFSIEQLLIEVCLSVSVGAWGQNRQVCLWGASSSYLISLSICHKGLLTDIPSSHIHPWIWMCSQWFLVTSVFRLSPVIWFTPLWEVLLFWSTVLARGVSSFGYGAAWECIFRNVYFEVITLRCSCVSDTMLLCSIIFCLCLYISIVQTVFVSSIKCSFSFFVLVPLYLFTASVDSLAFSVTGLNPAFPACLIGIPPSAPLCLAPACLVWYKYRLGPAWWGRVSVWGCGQFCSGYKQVSCGLRWPITFSHMLIERIRQHWCPACLHYTPCSVGNGQ